MGKGGARLVTTRSRCFSVEGKGGDGSSLTQTLSDPDARGGGGMSAPLGVESEGARLSRAQRAKVFVVERGNAYIYLACAFAFIPASFGFMSKFAEYYLPSCWVVRNTPTSPLSRLCRSASQVR